MICTIKVGAIPPWLPRSPPNPRARGKGGVGTGALPLQIFMNDLDLISFRLCFKDTGEAVPTGECCPQEKPDFFEETGFFYNFTKIMRGEERKLNCIKFSFIM